MSVIVFAVVRVACPLFILKIYFYSKSRLTEKDKDLPSAGLLHRRPQWLELSLSETSFGSAT